MNPEQLVGRGRIQTLLLLANPQVVVPLTGVHAGRLALLRGRGHDQARELDDVICRHFEKARSLAVAHHREHGPEFLLQREELPDEGDGPYRQP